MTCRCPAGQVTARLINDGWHQTSTGAKVQLKAFSFPTQVCAECPLRIQCYKKKTHGRRVRLHPQEAKLQAARAWQHSPDFDDFRKQRQVVEHRIARLVQLGIRQARYFGRHKTLFQVLMAATVANLTLVAGRTGEIGPSGAASGLLRLLLTAVQRLSNPAQRLTQAAHRLVAIFASDSPPCSGATVLFVKMAGSRPGL